MGNSDTSTTSSNTPCIENGWFIERSKLWPGEGFTLQVTKVLASLTSPYQSLLVFESTSHGKVLVLDGVIQLTERDEFAYQEMMTHVALQALKPRDEDKDKMLKVLIIGGGDGGVLREVVKHKNIEKIVMCELDEKVVEVSKQFFGKTMATGFADARVQLLFQDGAKFLKENETLYDVIIVDSSDPIGPAETLFQESFFSVCKSRLTPTGILCTQCESCFLHLDLIKNVVSFAKGLFPVVHYGNIMIPTYPSGQIGFLLAGNSPNVDIKKPNRPLDNNVAKSLKYYTPEIHQAAFVLPKFVKDALE